MAFFQIEDKNIIQGLKDAFCFDVLIFKCSKLNLKLKYHKTMYIKKY